MSLVALALFAFNITSLGLALIPLVAILLVVGWAIALFVIGLILRVGQGAEILAWGFIALIMPLSGIFYPVERAAATRCSRSPRRCRRRTSSRRPGASSRVTGCRGHEVGIAAAETVVLVAGAVWFLVAMLAVFRKRGYISRHV